MEDLLRLLAVRSSHVSQLQLSVAQTNVLYYAPRAMSTGLKDALQVISGGKNNAGLLVS